MAWLLIIKYAARINGDKRSSPEDSTEIRRLVVEYIILICLLLIIFLLWRDGAEGRFVSSRSSDWFILLWYKDKDIIDKDVNVKTFDVDETINVQFVPIVGWKYSHWYRTYGNMSPITPPSYQVKDRLEWDDGYIRTSYWIRDGKQYEISSEWTSENDFWKDLADWVMLDRTIEVHGNVPNSLQAKLQNILELKKLEEKD